MMLNLPLVATDITDTEAYPADFQTVHKEGILHRSVHIEIVNEQEKYFVWYRMDGRMEILGGHVDWLVDQERSESYEEAAIRETIEELNLLDNWTVDYESAYTRLKEHISPIARLRNKIPSSHGNNNEWVTVFSLSWPNDWGDPCRPGWCLSNEGYSPHWLSLEEIKLYALDKSTNINAALNLFLQRRGILVSPAKDTSN
ncbi:MAG: NUDIX hydrolase [Anaerolineae bacterium]|nr:NUDIX hydrolase [Anaerolineae bacterium]